MLLQQVAEIHDGGAVRQGKIHMGNWFEADDDKPQAKAVRAVPKFGEKPRPKKK